MNRKFLLTAALAAAAAGCFAAPEITVSSNIALPSKNLVDTADFSKGVLGSWVINSPQNRDLVVIDKTDGQGDKISMKIVGDPARSPNAYHRLSPAVPFKAGEPYYIRYSAKRSGSNPKLRSAASLAFPPTGGGKYKYAPTPEHIAGDCDWAEYEYQGILPVDSTQGTLYMCYYKQSGCTLYDNIEFRHGWAELNIAVKGEGLQQIVVRNSVTGIVLKEKIKGAAYSKIVKVPAFGSNSVEVLDRTGEITGKLYPADVDSNIAASDNVVPLTPVKRVVMAAKTSDSFTFALPELAGKKAYLCFSGRLYRKNGIAGYTNALKIKVNSKALGLNNVVNPGKIITLKSSPGKRGGIVNSNGFVLFYSNTFAPIPAHNNYHPTSFENGNPYNFKLDITKLVEAGLNVVDLQAGIFKDSNIYLDNLRVEIE